MHTISSMSVSNALTVYTGPGAARDDVNVKYASTGTNTYGYKNEVAHNKCSFVGLSNQGATCYMNSLLQTLYMTPEFRGALYKWKYDEERDGSRSQCIALQLQRLFGLLQLSSMRAIDTVALTKSFGWEVGCVSVHTCMSCKSSINIILNYIRDQKYFSSKMYKSSVEFSLMQLKTPFVAPK